MRNMCDSLVPQRPTIEVLIVRDRTAIRVMVGIPNEVRV